jgi:isochorismate synthase
LEGFDRGLYAGVLGWCDAEGNGEAAVALRSALMEDRRARLFAGAGIMNESSVDDELQETQAKALAVLEAL